MAGIFDNPRVQGWTAIGISACALLLTIDQARQTRDQAMRSVRPLCIAHFYQSKEAMQIDIDNGGLGPAQLRWAEVSVGGEQQRSWEEVFKKLGIKIFPRDGQEKQNTTALAGLMIPAGTSKTFVKAYFIEAGAEQTEEYLKQHASYINSLRNRVRIEFCYCSMYDECFYVEIGGSRNGLVELSHREGCKLIRPQVFGTPDDHFQFEPLDEKLLK